MLGVGGKLLHSDESLLNILSFLQSLALAGRQLAFYPSGHPQRENIIHSVMTALQNCCNDSTESLSLHCSQDLLFVDNHELPQQDHAINSLKSVFTAHDIVAIHFHKNLKPEEIHKLHKFLWHQDRGANQNQAPAEKFAQLAFDNIEINFIDYSHLHKKESSSNDETHHEDKLWETLISTVSFGGVSNNKDVESFLTEYVDNTESNSLGEQQVGSLLNRILQARYHTDQKLDDKTMRLAQTLSPKVLDTLLASTFSTLDKCPDKAPAIVASLPKEVLSETFQRAANKSLKISSRIFDLLGEFSQSTGPQSTTPIFAQETKSSSEPLDLLFHEENLDDYVPLQYQNSLHKILAGEVISNMAPSEAALYCADFQRFNIEKHCCETLFELLDRKVDKQTELNIQNTFIELANFFVQTGDFKSLSNIFLNWSRYLYSGSSHVLFLEEQVLANQTTTAFINEVLDTIRLWAEEKYAEIVEYIKLIGEPYAEQLVERLKVDEDKVRRHLWMDLLVELGAKAHPIIIANLESGPWFLIRNLLFIMGRQNESVPTKTILKYSNHEYPQIRKEAIKILAGKKPGIALRLIYKELTSDDSATIAEMCELAERNHDHKIIEQLHKLIQATPQTEDELTMAKQILKTLAVIGHPRSQTFLTNILTVKGFFRPRKQKIFHTEVKQALEMFGK